jgi:integrase
MRTSSVSSTLDIQHSLKVINARLKAAHLGVNLQLRGNSLSLVATLTPRPNSTQKKRHQQRIPLKLLASPQGLKQAEAEAKLLGARIAAREFDWSFYLAEEEESSSGMTCQDWIDRFRSQIIATNFAHETPEAADLLWRRRFYNLGLSQLNLKGALTADAIFVAVQKSKPNTRSRQLHTQNLLRLAEFAGIKVDLEGYKGKYSSSKVAPRDIPNDAEIEANITRLKSPAWRWVYAMMATYGIRDHEVFFCDVEWREQPGGKPPVLIAKVQEGKTGSREVSPLHPEWVDRWHLWDKKVPNVKARIHEEYGERVSRTFKRAGTEFGPYDLRHAYAIRASVEYRLPLPVAAALCGHSPNVHLAKYNRWINQDQHNKAWSDAVDQHRAKKS